MKPRPLTLCVVVLILVDCGPWYNDSGAADPASWWPWSCDDGGPAPESGCPPPAICPDGGADDAGADGGC